MRLPFAIFLLFTNCSLLSAANFSDASLSLLRGSNYKVEPDKNTTVTFEYAAAWDNWDMFMFIDRKDFDSDGNGWYGEFSPRIKIYSPETELINQITFSTTFERGKNGVRRDLYGVGMDLNLEDFRYFKLNLYRRDDPDRSGHGEQLTVVWAYPFEIGEVPLVLDGFADWVFSSDEEENNLHFNPQLKIDMQKWLGGDVKWYLGIEYDYWSNKFGIKDSSAFETNQNTFSLLAKWHF